MSSASTAATPDYARFAIGFDDRDRARLHALIDEVLDSNRWSEAGMNERFEQAWAAHNGAPAVAMSSWAGGAMAALQFAHVQRRDGAVPVEHVHGDAARRDQRRCRRAVRRLQSRGPVHVVRRLRGEGGEVQAARGVPRPHRWSYRVRRRPDRRVLPGERDLPDRRLRARARRSVERSADRAPTATPASTRCTRRRRSRPARAGCSCRPVRR